MTWRDNKHDVMVTWPWHGGNITMTWRWRDRDVITNMTWWWHDHDIVVTLRDVTATWPWRWRDVDGKCRDKNSVTNVCGRLTGRCCLTRMVNVCLPGLTTSSKCSAVRQLRVSTPCRSAGVVLSTWPSLTPTSYAQSRVFPVLAVVSA